jgi:hypothetical protein
VVISIVTASAGKVAEQGKDAVILELSPNWLYATDVSVQVPGRRLGTLNDICFTSPSNRYEMGPNVWSNVVMPEEPTAVVVPLRDK